MRTPRGLGIVAPAAAAALLGVAALAVAGGPVLSAHPARWQPVTPSATPTPPSARVSAAPTASAHPSKAVVVLPGWFDALVEAALVAVVVGLLALVVRRVVRGRRGRAVAGPTVATIGAATPAGEAADPDRDAVRRGVATAVAGLDNAGDPRQAVLACWLGLERAVARAGVTQAPSETSAELTRRVLASLQVAPEELDRLHELFLWARFARHPVDAAAGARARAALDAVRRDLDRAAPVDA